VFVGPIVRRGSRVSGYRVERLLGAGGMGAVYEATQLSLDRTVALKILAPHLSEDEAFRERFRREGVIQASLDHPHIVPIYEAGSSRVGLFIAMKLVRGSNLKQILGGRPIPPDRILTIVRPVADALTTAHEAGLIHRDVKPQNILVDVGDYSYLADFGLTKAPSEASLTRPGQHVGTVDYISPEQIRDDEATPQSDVYALGAVLYECFSGVVPFRRDTQVAVIYAHLQESPPSLRQYCPQLPPAVEAAIRKAMAKDPSERHQSPSQLVRDLSEALGSGAIRFTAVPQVAPARDDGAAELTIVDELADAAASVAEASQPDRRKIAAAVAGLALCVGAGVGFGVAWSSHHAASAPSLQLTTPFARLAHPAQWEGVAKAPLLGLPTAAELAPVDGSAARMVVALGQATRPRYLAKPLVAKIKSTIPAPRPARIGDVVAYRYAGLRLTSFAAPASITVVPTDRGTLTLGCLGSAGAIAACSRIVGTLQVRGAKPIDPRPDAAYAAGLSAALDRLTRAQAAPRRALSTATTSAGQAALLRRIAALYKAAGLEVAKLHPRPADAAANKAVVTALRRSAAAYEAMAAAAARRDAHAYASDREVAMRADGELDQSVRALVAAGYRVESG
jgi:Protein kinase domain